MSTDQLYHWFGWIGQLRPYERITRVGNMAWLMTENLMSKSIHLSRIAGKIPGMAIKNSIVQRTRRFLNNSAVRVGSWYGPIARDLLESQANGSATIRLILDGTQVGFGHQLLTVAIAYRR